MATSSPISFSESSRKRQKKGRPNLRFNYFQDIMLLQEVAFQNPNSRIHKKPWESIAKALSTYMPTITSRCCKERATRLLKMHRENDMAILRKWGTEEQFLEREELLQTISLQNYGRKYGSWDSKLEEETRNCSNTPDAKEKETNGKRLLEDLELRQEEEEDAKVATLEHILATNNISDLCPDTPALEESAEVEDAGVEHIEAAPDIAAFDTTRPTCETEVKQEQEEERITVLENLTADPVHLVTKQGTSPASVSSHNSDVESDCVPRLKRKAVSGGWASILRKRHASEMQLREDELAFKWEQLEVEKRRLNLEERKLSLATQRWDLEKEERREDKRMIMELIQLVIKK